MIGAEELRDDTKYYGKEGKKYLSNSDIGTLLSDPKMFKVDKEGTLPMLLGRYFHTLILEPKKIKDFIVSESSSRNTKMYKELINDSDEPMLILQKEVDALEKLVAEINQNVFFNELIYMEDNKFEEPAIGEIGGVMWKGKADIVTQDLIIDLKTTSKIDDFKYAARRYNYDSQAWIYNQLFNKPMIFIVIEKGSGRMGMYDCSDEFLDMGKDKVFEALEIYKTFFGESPTEDINQYHINDTL
tara:strand:- start:500 stop:1228 length:729 start_codon:yes stop_codon:yes gene_type:complete